MILIMLIKFKGYIDSDSMPERKKWKGKVSMSLQYHNQFKEENILVTIW